MTILKVGLVVETEDGRIHQVIRTSFGGYRAFLDNGVCYNSVTLECEMTNKHTKIVAIYERKEVTDDHT